MNEFQLAFQHSMSQWDQCPDREKIHQALREGKYVVTMMIDTYCGTTDALMGATEHFYSAHDTEAEADCVLSEIDECGDHDPDIGYEVRRPDLAPHYSPPPFVGPPVEEEDVEEPVCNAPPAPIDRENVDPIDYDYDYIPF